MTFEELKKMKLVVRDLESGFILSDDEQFFLDDNMNLCILDVDKDGKIKIKKASENLYEITLE